MPAAPSLEQARESIKARRVIEFGQDRQIEKAVVDQRVRTKRYAAAGLPAVADCQGQKWSLPRKALGAKPAVIGRELGKARDSGDGIG